MQSSHAKEFQQKHFFRLFFFNYSEIIFYSCSVQCRFMYSTCSFTIFKFSEIICRYFVCLCVKVPYMLIMEDVELGSLRTFLRVNKERLCKDEELQHLFTIALYHIAKALDHLHSKMVLVLELHLHFL